jgi:hypothetical protein
MRVAIIAPTEIMTAWSAFAASPSGPFRSWWMRAHVFAKVYMHKILSKIYISLLFGGCK